MFVLVACEESQAVTKEFRKLGHIAFSCDIQDCSGGFPEWHIKSDVLSLINGFCSFYTCDGAFHSINSKWDILIAFPPCTYLSSAGNRFLNSPGRAVKRSMAADFFLKFVNANCPRIAIENPVGYMNSHFKKPTQIIQPFYFGDCVRKRTCLWLFNLPALVPDYMVLPPEPVYIRDNGTKVHWVESVSGSNRKKAFLRSKTFPGVAAAMAWQWSTCLY